jgi:LysM repeat protein
MPQAATPQNQQKACLVSEKGDKLYCMFNPASLSMARSNSWGEANVPGHGVPPLDFNGGNPGTMSFELTFDGTADGKPVTNHTDKLLKLMEIDPSLPGHDESTNNGRPPWILFIWGDMRSFKAVIESVDLTFTYFSATGVPLRVKANLSLRQFEAENAFGPQNPTSGTPSPHRTHQVQPGETLDRIASAHYGNPGQWSLIARANAIEDPLAVEPGTILAIPRLGD